MREKKGGALQKLKKRLSHSFGRLSKCLFGYLHKFQFNLDVFVYIHVMMSSMSSDVNDEQQFIWLDAFLISIEPSIHI